MKERERERSHILYQFKLGCMQPKNSRKFTVEMSSLPQVSYLQQPKVYNSLLISNRGKSLFLFQPSDQRTRILSE